VYQAAAKTVGGKHKRCDFPAITGNAAVLGLGHIAPFPGYSAQKFSGFAVANPLGRELALYIRLVVALPPEPVAAASRAAL
jgi:hypothetical protein